MVLIDWIKALYECDMRGLAGFIWLGIIALGVIFTAGSGGNLKVAKWSVIFVVGFYILAKLICGPSLIDTYRMKPMAEAISNYIVKNGIPKSLKDIPGLPYELEGCEKREYYQNYKSYKHVKKEEATLKQTEEKCYFKNTTLEFGFTTQLDTLEIGGNLKMISNNKTILDQFFNNRNKSREFRFKKIDIGSSKISGICNPMKQ